MKIKLPSGFCYRALILLLSAWMLASFAQALLAACVTAVASWPLYRRFRLRWSRNLGSFGTSLAFTGLILVFVLAPLVFAFGALVTETHSLLVEVAAADRSGIAAPAWLVNVPVVGPFLHDRWVREFAHPGALMMLTQRTDPTALLVWAQSLGQFMAHHVFIVAFTILLLVFAYERGEALTDEFRRVLGSSLGPRAHRTIDLATRAVRASVNSMLLVGLLDGLAIGLAYGALGVPHAVLWGAMTGALAIVPFLGYVAVVALGVQLAMKGAAATALLALAVACAVLLCGDKLLRPAIAGNGLRLGFVWVLMGCLGGFEALGLVGLVIGPVVIALARELWDERVRAVSTSKEIEPEGSHELRPAPD